MGSALQLLNDLWNSKFLGVFRVKWHQYADMCFDFCKVS